MKEANKVFQAMIGAGAVEEVSEQELRSWEGPVHYVPIQYVINKGSASAPCHLVTNSSFNNSQGLSLNGMLAKGPKILGDMWSLLVRFRNYDLGLVGEVSKAYYAMKTDQLEKHVRRFMWRWGV